MYARVQPALGVVSPPLRAPATALVIRDGPPQVVTVAPDSTARYQTVTIGRDLGTWVEVTGGLAQGAQIDRKSTRLNSSHLVISYAVFCLKKKKIACQPRPDTY